MLLVEGARVVSVEVVHPAAASPYIRARDDGVWTDDLLTLPRFKAISGERIGVFFVRSEGG